MMACGCPVIEMDNEINNYHYGARDIVSLAQEQPQAVADKISELIENEDIRQVYIRKGLQFAQQLPGLKESTKQIEYLLKRKLCQVK